MLVLRLDGEEIATIEEQATAIRLQSRRGETSVTGLGPDDGVIDIIVDRVAPGGPPRLDQLEAQAYQDIRDRGEEGQVVGYTRDFQVHPSGLSANQGVHNESLREGGVDKELTRRTRANGVVPSVDLGQGLMPDDVETRTARLEAFGRHGDAQRAIDDNPAGGGGQTYSDTAPDSLSSSDSVVIDESDRAAENDKTSDDDAPPSGPDGSPSSEDKNAGIKLPGKSARKVTDSPQA